MYTKILIYVCIQSTNEISNKYINEAIFYGQKKKFGTVILTVSEKYAIHESVFFNIKTSLQGSII